MEVREGYKQTEVGLIPEDWNIKKIGEVCKLINGRGFKPYEWESDGLPIIRIQNLNGSDDFNYYQGGYDKKIEIEDGQLLFAWSGSRGTSFGPHIWSGSLGLLNYHTWKIVIKENEVFPKFFLHALKQLTKFIEEKAHGASALVHTQKWEMECFKFPLPSSKPEQKAIAKALSDVDALIVSLEQLITKKQLIKQGAMQELLTEKRRLSGFSERWKEKRLGDMCEMSSGGTPSTKISVYYDGEIPWLSISDISKAGKYVSKTEKNITDDGLINSSARLFKKGILLLAMYASIGKCCISKVDISTSQAILGIKPNSGICTEFLYYFFLSIQSKLVSSGQQGTQSNLNKRMVEDIAINLPILLEQKAIATILSDMDTEIEALETKLAKTRQLKEGMMHELLTGRIRLI